MSIIGGYHFLATPLLDGEELEWGTDPLDPDTDGDGLISYGEYVFFLTLLSIPTHDFAVAFRMFDDDGNGAPDCLEMLLDDEDGPEGPDDGDWSIEDFYVGEDFVLELVDVDADNGTAMVFIASHVTLDADFRMKL